MSGRQDGPGTRANNVTSPVSQQNTSAGSQNRNSKAPSKTLTNALGSETIGVGASILKNGVKQTIENIASGGVGGIMSAIRGFGIPIDGLSGIFGGGSTASWSRDDTGDWRMRLSIPVGMSLDGVLQAQLNETQGMIFPYTPSIIFQHSAQYSMMKPTHSNYPFPVIILFQYTKVANLMRYRFQANFMLKVLLKDCIGRRLYNIYVQLQKWHMVQQVIKVLRPRLFC